MADLEKTLKKGDLTSLSSFFAASTFFRHLLFFVLACGAIFISGYYFGTFDQSIHIPFLKKAVDSSLYSNDPFFELSKTHYSYFWYFFQPLYRLGVLELGLFLVHVFSTYLTFYALWRLSNTLFNNKRISLLCVIAFVFPHIGFAAFPIFEFSLLNRTFVLPFLLISIDWYLQKKYLRSFILLGLMNNMHALSVNFVMFMFGVDLLFRFFRERLKMSQKSKVIISFLAFFIASLPVLIWKFGKSPLDFSLRPEWFHTLTQSLMYTVFYPISTSSYVVLLTVFGLSSFLLYFVMIEYKKLSLFEQNVTHFMYAVLFLIGLEVLVSEWLPITFLVQFQIIRIGIFALIFAYLFFIASLFKKKEDNKISKTQFNLQFLSVLLSITTLVPFVVDIMMRFLPKRDRITAGVLTIFTSFIAFVLIAWNTGIWRPGIFIYPVQTDWVMVQEWAKQNTPQSAIFLTPPDKWWFFEPDWRVYSERSTVATLSEVLEFAFTPEYADSWKIKFDDIAPLAREKFDGDLYKTIRLTKDAYASLSDAQMQTVAVKYGATYIVVEKPKLLSFPLVYENSSFAVYHASSVLVDSPDLNTADILANSASRK